MNTQKIIINPFYSLQKDIYQNFYFLDKYITFPENNKILRITQQENFLTVSPPGFSFRLEFSEDILKKFKCLSKEKNIVERIKQSQIFFEDIIIPKMKDLNLPCWKLLFEEFTKEDSKKLFEQHELSQKRQDDLQKLSSYYQKDFHITQNYDEAGEKSFHFGPHHYPETKLIENYFRKFHSDPLKSYYFEFQGLTENHHNIENLIFFAEPKNISAHEKYHIKKHLKQSGFSE